MISWTVSLWNLFVLGTQDKCSSYTCREMVRLSQFKGDFGLIG